MTVDEVAYTGRLFYSTIDNSLRYSAILTGVLQWVLTVRLIDKLIDPNRVSGLFAFPSDLFWSSLLFPLWKTSATYGCTIHTVETATESIVFGFGVPGNVGRDCER